MINIDKLKHAVKEFKTTEDAAIQEIEYELEQAKNHKGEFTMSETIKDILAQRGTGRSLIDDLTYQIDKLESARSALADQYGLPVDIGLGAYYIPEKFCDALAEYEDLSQKDQKLFREFEAEFDEYFYMTEYGGGVWQPSRNC